MAFSNLDDCKEGKFYLWLDSIEMEEAHQILDVMMKQEQDEFLKLEQKRIRMVATEIVAKSKRKLESVKKQSVKGVEGNIQAAGGCTSTVPVEGAEFGLCSAGTAENKEKIKLPVGVAELLTRLDDLLDIEVCVLLEYKLNLDLNSLICHLQSQPEFINRDYFVKFKSYVENHKKLQKTAMGELKDLRKSFSNSANFERCRRRTIKSIFMIKDQIALQNVAYEKIIELYPLLNSYINHDSRDTKLWKKHIEGILFTDKLSSLKKRLIKGKLSNISKGKCSADYRMRFPEMSKTV